MSSSDGFSIDPEAAGDVHRALIALTDEMDQSLQALGRKVTAFAQGNNGPDVDAYKDAQTQWTAEIQQVRDNLDGHGKTLARITDNYVTHANNQTRLFAR